MVLSVWIKVLVGVVFLASIGFSVAMYTSLHRYEQTLKKRTIAVEIVLQVFQRKMLAGEYLLTRAERPRIQWLAKNDNLQKQVEAHEDEFQKLEERPLIEKIRIDLVTSKKIFDQLTVLSELESSADPSNVQQEKQGRLEARLSVKAQGIIASASELERLNNQVQAETFRQIVILFSVSGFMFFLLLLGSFWVILRNAKELEKQQVRDEAMKKQLMSAQAKTEAMFSAIGDGLIVTDEKGIIIKVNQTTVTLLGLPNTALVGKWHPKVITMLNEKGAIIPAMERPNTQALLDGKPVVGVLYFERSKDTRFPVTLTASPIMLGDKLVGVIEVFRDITKEKEFEQMKDDFMNIAAHDLRTPSTAVKGFVSMIRKGDFGPPPTGEIGEALKDVEDATDRMITMVNDFLTVSRIEQGRLKIIPQPLDISQFLHDLIRQLEVTIQNREVTLQLGAIADLPKAFADREKIAQVVTNIIDNALKHTEKGSVTVSARKTEKNMIEILVSDTGTGISPEDLPKLFGRYYRGKQTDAVATGRGGGLGLGLYVVKTIIELHGGTVWAESVLGKSTTMHFTLPLSPPRDGED